MPDDERPLTHEEALADLAALQVELDFLRDLATKGLWREALEPTVQMGCLVPACPWRIDISDGRVTDALLAHRDHFNGHSHQELVDAVTNRAAFDICHSVRRMMWEDD